MSIKIYTAWRCPLERIEDADQAMKDRAFYTAYQAVTKLMDNVRWEAIEEAYNKDGRHDRSSWADEFDTVEAFDKAQGVNVRFREAMGLVISASRMSERTFIDVDASANFFIRGGWIYIIPYGDCPDWKRWEAPYFMEDFSYWNNTDKPDEVSEKAWKERAKTWDKVACENHDRCRWQRVWIELGKYPHSGSDKLCRLVGADPLWFTSAVFYADQKKATIDAKIPQPEL